MTDMNTIFAPADRDIAVKVSRASGNYILASHGLDTITVRGIPRTISNSEAIRRLNGITLWPSDSYSPRALDWCMIRDLKRGTILRTYRDGSAVRTKDIAHWAGGACIGA